MSGPIPAGSPSVSARGCIRTSTVFDHRSGTQLLQIALALVSEALLQYFLANLALARQFAGRCSFLAEREQLDALLGRFRRRKPAFQRIVQDLAHLRGQITGRSDDHVTHCDVLEAACETNAFLAILKTIAQSLGFAFARRDHFFRRSAGNDEQDRPQRIFVADRRLVFLSARLQRVKNIALANLEVRLELAANDLRPAEIRPDPGLYRVD